MMIVMSQITFLTSERSEAVLETDESKAGCKNPSEITEDDTTRATGYSTIKNES